MAVLDPIADVEPNPDCVDCGGEGVDKYRGTAFFGEVFEACPKCWEDEDDEP